MESELVAKSRSYAEEVIRHLPGIYTYHNLAHTRGVVEAAKEIGSNMDLSAKDLEAVTIAAWFHDIGFEKGGVNHEQNSIDVATKMLTEWKAPEKIIQSVRGAIAATRMPQNPGNLLEQVLCDADLHHLANPDLLNDMEGLRLELANCKNVKFDNADEWLQFNVKFLKQHRYFTAYGQRVLEDRKQKNVKKLKKMMKKDNENDEGYKKDLEKQVSKLQAKLDKKANPDRGIETMFKIASQNHTTLSGMADTKANIMISINSIVLSVVITVLFRKLDEFPNLLIPTLMLVAACLLTIVYAILATRPNISSGTFTKEDIQKKRTNLLFFGNFHGMELADYDAGVREMMKDGDYLYGSLIKDIYYNGIVLARKYKLLRISYSIFMFGFVSSIIGFTIALLMYYYPSNHL